MLQLALDGRIHVVTFDNPPDNSFNEAVFTALGESLDELLGPKSDLLVFTGAGRVFSKGFDLDLIRGSTDADALRSHLARLHEVYARILSSPKPVIAAINGHCFGGGLELALVCHFRLCRERARLGLPESTAGIIPGLGGIHRLARLVGQAKALELVALGDMISADDALRLNIVNRVLPRDGFMDHVMSFAKALLVLEPGHLAEIIRLVAGSAVWSEEENVRQACEAFVRLVPGMVGRG